MQYGDIVLSPPPLASFKYVNTSIVPPSAKLYNGQASVGTKVIFVPYNQPTVGVFDVSDSNFRTVSIDGDLEASVKRFVGAAVVGTKVIISRPAILIRKPDCDCC